jgi:hypothetical protein
MPISVFNGLALQCIHGLALLCIHGTRSKSALQSMARGRPCNQWHEVGLAINGTRSALQSMARGRPCNVQWHEVGIGLAMFNDLRSESALQSMARVRVGLF